MKKRILSLFLTLALCMGLTIPTFAAESTPYTFSDDYVELTFDAATVAKETLNIEDWESGEMIPEEVTMVTLKPGSSMTVLNKENGGDSSLSGFYLRPTEDGSGYYFSAAAAEVFTGTVDDVLKGDIYAFWGENGEIICMKVGAAEQTTHPVTPAFTDVPADAYFYESVKWAVTNGITNGTTDTTFAPGDTCTNAHILTFMWRAAGSPEPTGSNPFTNVTGSEYYAKAAMWAHEKGMVSGTVFESSKACTRAMTMEYFWKQAGSPKTEVSDKFTDVATGDSYAQAVAWAVSEGITDGTSDTTFSPAAICTRGQIVTFLYRALV